MKPVSAVRFGVWLVFLVVLGTACLPPIWNGSTLVPWTQFHRESIDVARACHDALGIEHPQQQLKGTYAKPAWDPHSAIWTDP